MGATHGTLGAEKIGTLFYSMTKRAKDMLSRVAATDQCRLFRVLPACDVGNAYGQAKLQGLLTDSWHFKNIPEAKNFFLVKALVHPCRNWCHLHHRYGVRGILHCNFLSLG